MNDRDLQQELKRLGEELKKTPTGSKKFLAIMRRLDLLLDTDETDDDLRHETESDWENQRNAK